jgi:uncharacterized protein with PIN domain
MGMSGGPEGVYDRCDWCGAEILNAERTDGQQVIEVLQSDMLLVLCESCGNSLDADALRQTLEGQHPA